MNLIRQSKTPYSYLGGVKAPINSAYTMPSMSNPNAERPVKRIDTRIPSQTELGGIAVMKNFNPYNTLGTYRKDLNTMRNDQRLPKKFGGQFFTNVNLENPSGNPVLKSTGINYGGYLPITTPTGVGKKICAEKSCKMKIKTGGIFGGGHSLFGLFIKKATINVPCEMNTGGACVCKGTDQSC